MEVAANGKHPGFRTELLVLIQKIPRHPGVSEPPITTDLPHALVEAEYSPTTPYGCPDKVKDLSVTPAIGRWASEELQRWELSVVSVGKQGIAFMTGDLKGQSTVPMLAEKAD